jgi:hypothetical protein
LLNLSLLDARRQIQVQQTNIVIVSPLAGRHGEITNSFSVALESVVVDGLKPGGAVERYGPVEDLAHIEAGKVQRGETSGRDVAPIEHVWQMLRPYATAAGVPGIAPHDCRRTAAKLCRAAGGELEQIQLLLGHASVQTTERYLGTKQDLVHAPNDGIKLRVAV